MPINQSKRKFLKGTVALATLSLVGDAVFKTLYDMDTTPVNPSGKMYRNTDDSKVYVQRGNEWDREYACEWLTDNDVSLMYPTKIKGVNISHFKDSLAMQQSSQHTLIKEVHIDRDIEYMYPTRLDVITSQCPNIDGDKAVALMQKKMKNLIKCA